MSNVIRVVVADDNDIVRQMIVDTLSEDEGIEVVGSAADGAVAVQLIKETHPDIVLLDLIMPMVDGIGVMETIEADEKYGEKKPRYIVISAAGSQDIVNQALQTGAAYYIMKPFSEETLIKRVKRIAGETPVEPYTVRNNDNTVGGEEDVEQRVVEILRLLGVPVRMVGYKYLRDAILLAVADTESLMSVTKNIYPEIALKHGTSSGNVERNIRYVIESTWNNKRSSKPEDTLLRDLFRNSIQKPTNSEFILACSERIHYQMKN